MISKFVGKRTNEEEEKFVQQMEKLKALKNIETRFFILTILSPLIGALGIHFVSSLSPTAKEFTTHFDLFLFLVAASIRPLQRLFSNWNDEADDIQKTLDLNPDDIEILKEQFTQIKAELESSREMYLNQKLEITTLQSELSNQNEQVKRLLGKLSKRVNNLRDLEEQQRNSLLEKIDTLEKKSTAFTEKEKLNWYSSFFSSEPLRQKMWKILYFIIRRRPKSIESSGVNVKQEPNEKIKK